MIVLIHRLGGEVYWEYSSCKAGLAWRELKDLAVGQLEGSSAGSPKKLKTIEVFVGGMIEPELTMEEIIV